MGQNYQMQALQAWTRPHYEVWYNQGLHISTSRKKKKKKMILLNYKISPLQYSDVPLIHTIYIKYIFTTNIQARKITP